MWGADAWSSTPWASLSPAPAGTPVVPGVVPVVAHLTGAPTSFALSGAFEALSITGADEAYALPTIQGVQ